MPTDAAGLTGVIQHRTFLWPTMTDIQMNDTALMKLGQRDRTSLSSPAEFSRAKSSRMSDVPEVPAHRQTRQTTGEWLMSFLPISKTRIPQAPLSWPIVATVIVLLAGTATGLLYQDYRAVSTAGQHRAVSLSQIAATHVQQTLAAIDASLQLPDRDVVNQQLLARLSHAVPALSHLKVIDQNGLLVADADGAGLAASDFSGDAAFIFHRDHGASMLQLGRPFVSGGMSSDNILISRRISAPDGSFTGVIFGQLDPQGFSRFFAALGVSLVELVASDGSVLVRFPPTGSAMASALSPMDIANGFVAFQPLHDMPFTVGVSIDRREFLGPWESKRNIAMALVAALIALIVGGMAAMQKHTANAVAMVAMATRTRAETYARQQADELSKRKSDFLSQMSHELRTPLNAIIGFSEVIKDGAFGPVGQPKYQEYADDIHYSAQHLLSVINNILDLSKVESGKWQIADDDIPLDDLFDALLRLATERASRENVQLSIKSRPSNAVIRGDRRTLLQIMLNLTVNAIKFAGPNRLVDLDVVRMLDGGLEISVADYGDGMTKDDMEKAMKPFDAPVSHLNHKKQDTGLGLPLAAAFAELHGGKVILDSAPGIGTTARLRLPASRVQLAAV
jgi:signal transduction histidine kinase